MFEKIIQKLLKSPQMKLEQQHPSKPLSMINNFSPIVLEEIAERAKTGQPLYEPKGTIRKNYMDFRDIVFIPAQLKNLPLDRETKVDTTVRIGRSIKKPLHIGIPLMISGMGYGVAVSMEISKAMAKAATMAATAMSSGETGFLLEERKLADKYIVQFNTAKWGNAPEQLKNADAIEVRVSQGASGCDGYTIKYADVGARLAKHLGMEPGQNTHYPNRFPEVRTPKDWKKLVDAIREINADVPVIVKMGAGDIEGDIDVALDAGFDAIVIDGAGSGAAHKLELTINNFCLPLVYALPRANEYLLRKKVKDRITLIASGGIFSPGDFLKVIALGADAVYLGQVCLAAMVHSQLEKLPPGASSTQMYLYPGKYTDRLNSTEAANNLANYLKASVQEMEMAARLLGKSALRDITTDNLVALKTDVAEATGLKLAYGSFRN